jgi:hypothetical protein
MTPTEAVAFVEKMKAAAPHINFEWDTPKAWAAALADIDWDEAHAALLNAIRKTPWITPAVIQDEVRAMRAEKLKHYVVPPPPTRTTSSATCTRYAPHPAPRYAPQPPARSPSNPVWTRSLKHAENTSALEAHAWSTPQPPNPTPTGSPTPHAKPSLKPAANAPPQAHGSAPTARGFPKPKNRPASKQPVCALNLARHAKATRKR